MTATRVDWTGAEQRITAFVRKSGKAWRQLGREMGVDPNAIRGYVDRHPKLRAAVDKANAEYLAASPAPTFAERAAKVGKDDRIAGLERELKQAAREVSLRDTLTRLARESAPQLPAAPPLWRPERNGPAVTETMVQFWSDWHLYEEVSAERTRGLGYYTAEEGAARIARNVAAHLSIVNRLRGSGYVFPELVVALGGDFHPGTIHELERHSSEKANATLACYGVAWLIAQALGDLARAYDKVYVIGVPGNHGRLPDARRMQQKDPTRNWDYLAYLLVGEMLKGRDNVACWFPDSYGAQFRVRGWNFLMNHGHEIKSWNSVPYYGIDRYAQRTNALEAARGNTLHYHLLAHFHDHATLPEPAGEAFVNGSVIGGNEFSLNGLGKMGRPHQLMFGVHADHGVTHRWPLKLDIPRKDTPTYAVAPWRSVQAKGAGPTRVWTIA